MRFFINVIEEGKRCAEKENANRHDLTKEGDQPFSRLGGMNLE